MLCLLICSLGEFSFYVDFTVLECAVFFVDVFLAVNEFAFDKFAFLVDFAFEVVECVVACAGELAWWCGCGVDRDFDCADEFAVCSVVAFEDFVSFVIVGSEDSFDFTFVPNAFVHHLAVFVVVDLSALSASAFVVIEFASFIAVGEVANVVAFPVVDVPCAGFCEDAVGVVHFGRAFCLAVNVGYLASDAAVETV